MRKLLSKPFAAFCTAIFVFGLATYSVSSFQHSRKNRTEPARPFRLVQIESDVDVNGVETFKALRSQEVDVSGDWRSAVHPIGKEGGVEYANTPEGVFAAKGDERMMLNESKERPRALENRERMRTVEFYETHPDFVGTDVIAGLKVYRLRKPLDQKNAWLEMSNCPQTGHIPLRITLHRPDGSEHRIEAIRVEFK